MLQKPIRQENSSINVIKFIDFDKQERIFFNNLYLKKFDFVVRMPLVEDKKLKEDIRIEKFNLAKYTYLLSYD
ncbi:MAG: hypothetical protein ACFFAN_17190 [Promethearchaeota archaeon]